MISGFHISSSPHILLNNNFTTVSFWHARGDVLNFFFWTFARVQNALQRTAGMVIYVDKQLSVIYYVKDRAANHVVYCV